MPTKTRECNFSLKSMAQDGRFAGYASVFGNVDSQNDVIMPGAFVRTLQKRKGSIKLLWQHQASEPIGVFTRVREDERGLYVEGNLLLNLQRGNEAYSLLKSGAINGLSIGYTVADSKYNGEDNIRMITDVDLWEISLVTFPANEEAVVLSVKENTGGQEYKNTGIQEEKEHMAISGIPEFRYSSILDSIDRAIEVLEGKYYD